MQLTGLLKLMILAAGIQAGTSIYDISLTTIDGSQVSMNDFRGKKILVVIVPATNSSSDIAYLKTIDLLGRAYEKTYTIIAIPSYEYGYADTDQTSIKSTYQSNIGRQVVITKAAYAKKSSGKKQDNLFTWLTNISQNTHFDQEVRGLGQKYFINEEGELFAVFGAEMTLNSKLLDEMNQLQSTYNQ